MNKAGFRPEYESTRYLVHGEGGTVDARIGEPAPALDRLLVRHGAATGVFITADNPRSEKRSARENAAAERRLAEALRPWKSLPHDGVALDDSWREQGYFVLDIARADAVRLAERFGQNAIVWCELGRAPALLFTREVEDDG